MGDTRNVGILAMEIYFPSQYVDQEKLEEFDGVAKGKYTIGLGQHKMGFCNDREDINSMCLTVVHQLMEKTQTDYRNIGRLEVGTETIIDKSKSVKSVLMQLFESSGNTDIEGIDTTNACYGGTSALFNAISWVESKSWDGRLAIVVAGDIAVYASGSARPTGGAGAVAMLVGPNAPLIIDNVRATHMAHAYDFYKPDLLSEYPVVDGKLSIQCYLSALDRCYQLYCQKKEKLESHRASLEDFDYFCFHSPYCKLVQKSFARLFFNDLLRSESEAATAKFIGLEQFRDLKPEDTYFNRELEQAFVAYSKSAFGSKTQPSLLFASQVGNMYTPSLYGGLISLFVKCKKESLLGKRIGMFSYGSGLAASLFSVSVTSDLETLERLIASFSNIQSRLDFRRDTDPSDFVEVLKQREETHHKAPYQPVGAVDTLFPGTYYLTEVDAMHRRTYARRPIDNNQRVMCNGL